MGGVSYLSLSAAMLLPYTPHLCLLLCLYYDVYAADLAVVGLADTHRVEVGRCLLAREQRRVRTHLGSGRIVASETEVPSMLANLV